MNIILYLVFGALVGWLASMLVKSSQGLIGDIVLGILGAIVGGFIMDNVGGAGVTGFNLYSIVVAVLGAVVLVLAGRAFMRIIT